MSNYDETSVEQQVEDGGGAICVEPAVLLVPCCPS